jgi:DNA-binding NarL/FixJ family response regulator
MKHPSSWTFQRFETLTPLEASALTLVALGHDDAEAARVLKVSDVDLHLTMSRVARKLCVRRREEAIQVWRGEDFEAALAAEAAERRKIA